MKKKKELTVEMKKKLTIDTKIEDLKEMIDDEHEYLEDKMNEVVRESKKALSDLEDKIEELEEEIDKTKNKLTDISIKSISINNAKIIKDVFSCDITIKLNDGRYRKFEITPMTSISEWSYLSKNKLKASSIILKEEVNDGDHPDFSYV